jgi:hypothetical protein
VPSGCTPHRPTAVSHTPDVQSLSVEHESPFGAGGAAHTPLRHLSDAQSESAWQ